MRRVPASALSIGIAAGRALLCISDVVLQQAVAIRSGFRLLHDMSTFCA